MHTNTVRYCFRRPPVAFVSQCTYAAQPPLGDHVQIHIHFPPYIYARHYFGNSLYVFSKSYWWWPPIPLDKHRVFASRTFHPLYFWTIYSVISLHGAHRAHGTHEAHRAHGTQSLVPQNYTLLFFVMSSKSVTTMVVQTAKIIDITDNSVWGAWASCVLCVSQSLQDSWGSWGSKGLWGAELMRLIGLMGVMICEYILLKNMENGYAYKTLPGWLAKITPRYPSPDELINTLMNSSHELTTL